MTKFVLSGGFAIGALLVGGMLMSGNQADARPQYNKAFHETYSGNKEVAALAANAKCSACHVGAKKTDRNDYGMALAKLVGAKNEKDDAKIKAALKAAEGEKSGTEGKTFGDLLKDGKLPGKS